MTEPYRSASTTPPGGAIKALHPAAEAARKSDRRDLTVHRLELHALIGAHGNNDLRINTTQPVLGLPLGGGLLRTFQAMSRSWSLICRKQLRSTPAALPDLAGTAPPQPLAICREISFWWSPGTLKQRLKSVMWGALAFSRGSHLRLPVHPCLSSV